MLIIVHLAPHQAITGYTLPTMLSTYVIKGHYFPLPYLTILKSQLCVMVEMWRWQNQWGLKHSLTCTRRTHFVLHQALGRRARRMFQHYFSILRATCRQLHPSFPKPPEQLSSLEQLLNTANSRKLITRLYCSMQTTSPLVVPKAQKDWNVELDGQVTDEKWVFCCGQLQVLSPNYKLRLIHFKYLHRYYRTPSQLSRMELRPDSRCWRCGYTPATFLHMSRSCPLIAEYWIAVFDKIHDILGTPNEPHPIIGLLGYVKDTKAMHRKLHALLLLMAKRRVSIHWGEKKVPTIKAWITDVTFCHTQLSTFWELMPAASKLKDKWEPFLDWLKTLQEDVSGSLGQAEVVATLPLETHSAAHSDQLISYS